MKHEQFGKHLNFYDDDGNLIAMGSALEKLDDKTISYMYKMIEVARKEVEEQKKETPQHIKERELLLKEIKSLEVEIEEILEGFDSSIPHIVEHLTKRQDQHTERLFRLRDTMTQQEMNRLFSVYHRYLFHHNRARGYRREQFNRSLDFYFAMDTLKGLE